MNFSFRQWALCTVSLLLVSVAAEPAEKEQTDAPWKATIQADAAKELQNAADAIQQKKWKPALRIVQELLDDKRDVLALLPGRKGESEKYVNVRCECERLLASLPEAGRQAYQRIYGPRAADLLDEARNAHDNALLQRIVERYLYTEAGLAALRELARRNYAEKDYYLAALHYAQLLHHIGPARWTNDDLAQATAALHRHQDAARVERTLKQLLVRDSQTLISVGERKLTAEELRKEMERATTTSEWPVYRGDAARSNRGVGGPPLLEVQWRRSMFWDERTSDTLVKLLRRAEQQIQEKRLPIVSAFTPIAVTAQDVNGNKIPLLVCRTQFGIVAVDARNGHIVWTCSSGKSLQGLLEESTFQRSTLMDIIDFYCRQYPQIFHENSTLGSLSTDGKFVYQIDDFALPSSKQKLPNAPVPVGMDKEFDESVLRNSLFAFSLEKNSGKLSWTVDTDEEKSRLHNHCFLAPPLPLHGVLYALVQKERQMSLLCLDPLAHRVIENRKIPYPKIISLKPLLEVDTTVSENVLRRTQAAHLAYGDGVLVCPTNAGVVCGVDLLTQRLAWLYPYRDHAKERPFADSSHSWKTTAPVIAEGKVVFAPPDADSLHCLKLRDGSRLWSRKKSGSDVYLAGVYGDKVLIVGERSVRALSAANGETLWTRTTGLPSGQGVAAGDVYYLPLRRGEESKQPEIVALDIHSGQIVAYHQAKLRKGEDAYDVPANLTFVDGKLISQSAREIRAYTPLRDKLDESKRRSEHNPGDAAARLERAALLREAGQGNECIGVLRKLLGNPLDNAIRRQARALLFETMTKKFEREPRALESSLQEYKDLTDLELNNYPKEELDRGRIEQTRRQRSYHRLAARLRVSQGRAAEALQEYLDLAAVGPSDELLPLSERGPVHVRLSLWIRNRIDELWQQAAETSRRQMEEEIHRRLHEIEKSKDLAPWRTLLDVVGTKTAAGREGCLLFAEAVLARRESERYLECELLLLPLVRQDGDRVRAARAVELLARLMTAQDQFADAAYFYRLLRRDYGQIVVRDGKTGVHLWDTRTTDKRFLPYLDEAKPFASRRYQTHKERGDFPPPPVSVSFEQAGDAFPFFRNYRALLDIRRNYFLLQSNVTGRNVWEGRLQPTAFQAILPDSHVKNWPHFRYHTQGHLLVLPVERMIYGIDPLRRRILWQRDTRQTSEPSKPEGVVIVFDPRDAGPRLLYSEGWIQFPTHNLVLSDAVLCVATQGGLQGCDPRTGQLLWVRNDLPRSVRLFGEDGFVFAVEEDAKGNAVSSHVLRLADGATVSAPDFTTAFAQRVQHEGRTLLLTRSNDRATRTLCSYDIPTGKILWDKSYPLNSIVLQSEEPRFTGVVEMNGTIHLVDVSDGKEVRTGKIEDANLVLRKIQTIHLLADASNFYFACSTEEKTDADPRREIAYGIGDLGRSGILVQGTLLAFARAGGEFLWSVPIKKQRLVLDRFGDLPFIFLTSDYVTKENGFVSALCIQKRNGKVLYEEAIKDGSSFHGIRPDPRTGIISYSSSKRKIVLSPRTEDGK